MEERHIVASVEGYVLYGNMPEREVVYKRKQRKLVITPYWERDNRGIAIEAGISLWENEKPIGKWGTLTPFKIIGSYRGAKILGMFDTISSGDLCYSWYLGSRKDCEGSDGFQKFKKSFDDDTLDKILTSFPEDLDKIFIEALVEQELERKLKSEDPNLIAYERKKAKTKKGLLYEDLCFELLGEYHGGRIDLSRFSDLIDKDK